MQNYVSSLQILNFGNLAVANFIFYIFSLKRYVQGDED